MNIAKAFIERNRLKRYISKHTDLLETMSISHRADLGERDWHESNGISFDEMLDKILKAKKMLTEFNIAIDKANSEGGRELLDKLEGKKAQLATLQWTVGLIRNFQAKKPEWVNGETVITEYNLDVNAENVLSSLKKAEKDVNALEDEIAAFNSSKVVKLSKELEDFLSSYNN